MYVTKKDVVAINHVQLDAIVVEEGIMKRPWLTVAIYLPTREVLDVNLSLSPPSDKPDSAIAEFTRRIEERFGSPNCKKRTPCYGGAVERFFSKLNGDIIHHFSGPNEVKTLVECSASTLEELKEFNSRCIPDVADEKEEVQICNSIIREP